MLHGLSALIRALKQTPMKANYAFDFPSYRSQKFRHSAAQSLERTKLSAVEPGRSGCANVKTQAFQSYENIRKLGLIKKKKKKSVSNLLLLTATSIRHRKKKHKPMNRKNINYSKTHLLFSEAEDDFYTLREREVGFGFE